tara:strand:+ start:225 stop:1232 length:1008 start_codon:yes stop_codon:yes gene_type:complete
LKKTFVVAELSGNHNNDFDLAIKTITAISETGADAVKVQTYKPESLTIKSDKGYFLPRKDGIWKGYTSWELYKKASLPYEWHAKLKQHAEDKGLIFFSSPFDKEGVDFLETLDVPIYKIASFEIVDISLIEYCAKKKKPMIISTGVAEIDDINLAISTCQKVGNNDITLLKCTSEYPAKISDANILTIPDMKKRFQTKIGISDHTMGSTVPTTAVALGATVVEKHFILDRKLGGTDSSFSMEPKEFKEMIYKIRETEKSLGNINYDVSERNKLRRRSLFVVRDLNKGEKFTSTNVRSIRPGYGLHPKYYSEILNKISSKEIKKGTPLSWKLISKE